MALVVQRASVQDTRQLAPSQPRNSITSSKPVTYSSCPLQSTRKMNRGREVMRNKLWMRKQKTSNKVLYMIHSIYLEIVFIHVNYL